MKTWNNKDKKDWPRGEWDNEPDKAHWVDESTGLDCLIVRGSSGALCGYAGVPKGNSHFEKEYFEIDVEVHGGLTFADKCSPGEDESVGVCHPKVGAANEFVWWLGFDCAHAWDVLPSHAWSFGHDSTYRNFDYVKQEVTRLAGQLNQAA